MVLNKHLEHGLISYESHYQILDFQPTKSANSLFVKINNVLTVYILIYVDDLIVIGDNEAEASNIIQYLDK